MTEVLRHIVQRMGLLKPLGLMGMMSLMGLLGLMGCSDDTEQDGRHAVTFEAQPCATAFEGESDHAGSRAFGWTTRGDDDETPSVDWTPPSNYYLYNDAHVLGLFAEQTDLFYKSIDVFFTRNGKDPMHGTFSYKKPVAPATSGTWRLGMDIEETGDYYVYGYIPKEVANSVSIAGNSSYSEGAVLTINGIKTVTHSDVCVIVGAKDGTDAGHATSSTGEDLATGDFKVKAQRVVIGQENTGSSNFIYMLFDHLYSALAFNFTIDATYNALRTIKVRKLELIGYGDANGTKIKARYNVVVRLKSNTTGTSPIQSVTFTPDATSGNLAFEPIYEDKNGVGVTLDPDIPTGFMGCFVPGQNTNFTLRTTYDVYDKNQAKDEDGNLMYDSEGHPVYNLIRYGCIADNAIDLRSKFHASGILRGQLFKITIKVIPTYLYVLSEPDMDNPTLVIN